MKLLTRIAILLKADAHGVVESLEDRALLLKQHLREAELELDRKRARIEALHDECRRLHEVEATGGREMQALEEDIGLALAGGKDDLARFAIRRLLPRRHEAGQRHVIQTRLRTEIDTLAAQLATQQSEFEVLRGRVRLAVARSHDGAFGSLPPSGYEVRDEEIEIELLRRRQSAPGSTGEPS